MCVDTEEREREGKETINCVPEIYQPCSLITLGNEATDVSLDLLQGNMNRVIAEHTLNTHSSRSHCIFTIHVEVGLL